MGLLTWLRGMTGAGPEIAEVARGAAEMPSVPPHLAQQARIVAKAARYQRAFQAARAAQQAREVEAERVRHELARGLALRRSHFPGDAEQERAPRITELGGWTADVFQAQRDDMNFWERR